MQAWEEEIRKVLGKGEALEVEIASEDHLLDPVLGHGRVPVDHLHQTPQGNGLEGILVVTYLVK